MDNSTDAIFTSLTLTHPWIKPWVIKVSTGLGPVVDQLLFDIEEILGVSPKPQFLRIVDKSTGSRDPYTRKLDVFLQPERDIDAQKNALASVIGAAVSESLTTCCQCGNKLSLMSTKTKTDLSRAGDYNCLEHIEFGVTFCLCCEEAAWQEKNSALDSDDSEGDAPMAMPAQAARHADSVKQNAGVADEWDIFDSLVDEEDENDDNEPLQDKVLEADAAIDQRVVIFTSEDVDRLEDIYKDAQLEHSRRVKSLVRKLRATSGNKRLATIPEDWTDYCAALVGNFPNFAEVIDFIRHQLALSSVGDNALRLPPFLLIGPPGVGKSEFALTLAGDMQSTLQIIDMASAQTSMTLSGSESHWSTSAPGTLFNTLALGEVANPIFMLDEIDKVGGDPRFDPISSLLQLLEPRQAKNFHDLSVPELLIDASHVIWIATGNDAALVNQPLLDRLSVFTIAEPAPAQMGAIVKNQYRRFVASHPSGAFFDADISQEALEELANHHPRRVRKMLEKAFGLAAFRRSPTLSIDDIRGSDPVEKQRNGVGFTATIN